MVTAAPAAPGPDLSGYAWEPMFGSETSPVANAGIYVIETVGNDLYVGGAFTDFAGIPAADRIVRWSGVDEEWQALEPAGATDGSIFAGIVQAIEVSGDNVYVGGDFAAQDFYNVNYSNLALYALDREKWYGFSGTSSGNAVSNGEVRTIYADETDGALYVGGSFINGADIDNADYLMIGTYNSCVVMLGACTTTPPSVTVCLVPTVTTSCAVAPPNQWSPAGDNGAGGPALGGFVSSVAGHPDGGVIVSGNFGAAGGVTGANSIAHFEGPYMSPQAWNAQIGVPSVTMYPTLNNEGSLFVAGWEGLYQRTTGTTWVERCAATLNVGGTQWTSMAFASSDLIFVGSQSLGVYACNPESDAATQAVGSGSVAAMALYNGALIAAGGPDMAGLPTADYIARYVPTLPETNSDSRQATDTLFLLVTLTAFTALAGTQLLRRA
jgi:hypothetical protein